MPKHLLARGPHRSRDAARPNPLTALALACAAVAVAPAAYAQTPAAPSSAVAQPVSLPAQPLGQAINAIARQFGVAVSVDAALVEGRTTPAVQGSVTLVEALRAVLADSGLEAQVQGGAVTVRRAVTPAAADGTLPEVRVLASADASPSQLPQLYAGGQIARGGNLGLFGNQDFLDTPFSTTSITEKLVRDTQVNNLAEALRFDPTVVQDTNPYSLDNRLIIRGFGADQQRVNGVLISTTEASKRVEPFERIEIVRGPQALLSGQVGSIGGGLNLVTKRAADEPLTRLTTLYQSDSVFGLHLDAGRRFGPDGAFGVRINAAGSSGETPIFDSKQTSRVASVALDFRGERLRASVDYIRNRPNTRNVQNIFPVSPDTPVFDPRHARPLPMLTEQIELRDEIAVARVEYDLADRTTLSLAHGTGRVISQGGYAVVSATDPAAGTATIGSLYEAQRFDTATTDAGLVTKLNTGPVSHLLAVNASRSTDKLAYAFVAGADTTRPIGDLSRFTSFPAAVPLTSNAQNRRTSVGVADTLGFADDRWLLTLGLRRQSVVVDSYDFPPFGQTANRYDQSTTTPAVALLCKVLPTTSLYASYIAGLQQGPTAPLSTPGQTITNPGEVFPPYETKQYEAGVKVDLGQLAVTAAVFQIAQPNGVLTPTGASGTFAFGLDGEVRNRGFELSVFGEPTPGVRLLGGLSLLDPQISKTADGTNEGNTSPGIPRHTFILSGEYDLPLLPGLTLTASMNRTGRQFSNNANTLSIPAFTTFDVGGRYTIESPYRITLRAGIQNVTDELYYASSRRNGAYMNVGAVRNARLSAEVDF